MKSIVSPHKDLIKNLKDLGFLIQEIYATDIVVASKKELNLFFIDNYTPLVPHSIGLILTSNNQTRSLLKHSGLRIASHGVTENHMWKYKLDIFISEDGFMNAVLNQNDITSGVHGSIRRLASKVLKSFFPMRAIAFSLFLNSFSTELGTLYAIDKIYESWHKHYNLLAAKGKKKIRVLDLTLKYMLGEVAL